MKTRLLIIGKAILILKNFVVKEFDWIVSQHFMENRTWEQWNWYLIPSKQGIKDTVWVLLTAYSKMQEEKMDWRRNC